MDTGLACYLAGLRTVDALRGSTLLGPRFETLVLGEGGVRVNDCVDLDWLID